MKQPRVPVPSRRGAPVVAMLISALLLGACGSDDDSGGGDSASTGDTAQVAAAQKFVEQGKQAPKFQDLPPLSKKPPTGKTVLWMDCGLPVCNEIGAGVKAAAEELGWKWRSLRMGSVPEEISNAWTQAVRIAPDAIAASGAPRALFQDQLDELAEMGVPYVTNGVLEPNTDGQVAVVAAPGNYVNRGKWMANWVAADTEGDANVLYVTAPEFPIVNPLLKSFRSELPKLCPSCTTNVIETPAAAIGKDLPGRIVSEVQRDPDINYIALPFGDLAVGVPQALRAAGLADRVKIVDANPTPTNYGAIKDGTQAAAVAESNILSGWTLVDALARYFVKDEMPHELYDVRPLQILTADNVSDDPNAPYIAIDDYQERFKSLWQLP